MRETLRGRKTAAAKDQGTYKERSALLDKVEHFRKEKSVLLA
jgi:hypothetical protein